MPSVQVKEFPQGLYDELKAYAETQHRSMAQQLIVAAEQMMNRVSAAGANAGSRPPENAETAEAQRAERIAKRTAVFARIDASIERARSNGLWKDEGPDSVDMIRDDREADDRHGGGPLFEAEAMFS